MALRCNGAPRLDATVHMDSTREAHSSRRARYRRATIEVITLSESDDILPGFFERRSPTMRTRPFRSVADFNATRAEPSHLGLANGVTSTFPPGT